MCYVLLLAVLFSLPLGATTFTGAILFGTDSSGNYQSSPGANNAWNTLGGDAPYNLYLTLNGSALNTGNGAGASINVPLVAGQTYQIGFAVEQPLAAEFGLNLFFDGDNTNPGISALMTYTLGCCGPPAIFQANTAANTPDLTALSLVPGAGTLVLRSGGLRVELTDATILPTLGSYTSAYSEIPDLNGPDSTGVFTLAVTNDVPEPSSLVLLIAPVLAVGFTIKSTRRGKP